MKQNTVKLNENQFKNLVIECVKRVLKEDIISQPQFRQVDDLNAYIQQNGLQMRQASKFQRINARPAEPGEVVVTYASDGTIETQNTASTGDWIVNNVSNPDNKWIMKGEVFQKKYQPVEGQPGVYMPKGGPMNAAQISEPISFRAPWGEQMNIDKGGYILGDPNNPADMYGISQKDFDSTYRFNQ